MMRKVYIAGKYDGPNVIEVLKNIRFGITIARELMLRGYAPYCPFLDFQIGLAGDTPLTKKTYQDVSMAFVSCCDAMLMLLNWEQSAGAKRERDLAISMNIPVFDSIQALNQWNVENKI